MSTNHVLIVVTSHSQIDADHPTGLWFEEFAVPFQVFRDHSWAVTVASPQGGAAPIDPRSAPADAEMASQAPALEALQHTKCLNTLDPQSYDALFFAGGHGTMYDFATAEVGQWVSQFIEADKVVASVCHGPACLVQATLTDGSPVIQGRSVTGFTNAEEREVQLDQLMPFLLETRLRELGATFVGVENWSDHVQIDGNLITGQNPQSSGSAAKALVTALEHA